MDRTLLAKELYALMVLYGKKVPKEDMGIFVDEWEKAVGWMPDNDFIAACAQVKESGTRFFPRPSDIKSAYAQQCRAVTGDGQISEVEYISRDITKLWDQHRKYVGNLQWKEAAETALVLMKSGVPARIMDSIIQFDRAKAVDDERGVIAAVNKAAKDFLPDDLGKWAMKAQESGLEPHDNSVHHENLHQNFVTANRKAEQLRNVEW